jgi:hypothetical protein
MNWKKKYNKVMLELLEYIDWNDTSTSNKNLKLNSPLIWDIYYEKYHYHFDIVKLSNVFVRKGSPIVKLDFQTIYQSYLKDKYYTQFIQPYVQPIYIENDVIINMKYELVLKMNIMEPLRFHILHYLIC